MGRRFNLCVDSHGEQGMPRMTGARPVGWISESGVEAPQQPSAKRGAARRWLVSTWLALAAWLAAGLAPAMAQPAPAPAQSPFGAVTPLPAPNAAPDPSAARGGSGAEFRFGLTAPLSGPAKEYGRQMSVGVETAFNLFNDAGGINGSKIKLVSADDGYDPARTVPQVRKLIEQDRVVGFVGNFGTANAIAALPTILERRMVLFAPATGSRLLRRTPPDHFVFNFRPSYAEETEAAVRYLLKVRGLKPRDIAVFTQDDPFGEEGYAGVVKAMRPFLGRYDQPPQRLTYKRNTIDVAAALAQLRARKFPPRAVVMAAVTRPAARFIELTRPLFPNLVYTNVSAVGSSSLAEELTLLGPQFANGVIVTQVMPDVNGYSKFVLDFKTALAKYFPGASPDYVSLEAYATGKLLIEGLKRMGPDFDTEKLIAALEGVKKFDVGMGAPLTFDRTEHQASHTVWGTQLDAQGRYKAIDLE